MLTTDRRAQILEILRQNGSVTVSKLAEKFETSESTIRRDLLALSQLGKINKVHGGATVLGQEFLHNEEDFNKKSLMNINEKEAIAKYAASQINDDDFVFIDAGTTTFLMTKYNLFQSNLCNQRNRPRKGADGQWLQGFCYRR